MAFRLSGSSLPTYLDCEGRWAIKNVKVIRDEFLNGGKAVKGVGSIFGTRAHHAMAVTFQHIIDNGHAPDWMAIAKEEVRIFEQEILTAPKPGVRFDQTTRSKEDGGVQLERVIREASFGLVPFLRPKQVEFEIGFKLAGNEWLEVVCHPDLEDMDEYLHDYKFSSKEFNYNGQAGTYLLARHAHFGRPAKGFIIDRIPRVGVSSVQPDVESKQLITEACLEAAIDGINSIATKLKLFDSERKAGKRSRIFRFNGNSKLCTQKTCEAWGTAACNQWTDKPKEKEE